MQSTFWKSLEGILRLIVLLICGGVLAACSTSSDEGTQGKNVEAYLTHANERQPRQDEYLFFDRVALDGKTLITHLSINQPGTPLSAYPISQNEYNDKLREEYLWICTNRLYKPLHKAGYAFVVQVTDRRASFNPKTYRKLPTVDVTRGFCRFTRLIKYI